MCIFLQLNRTALHLAAGGGHNIVMTFVINHGAGIDDVDDLVSAICACYHEARCY